MILRKRAANAFFYVVKTITRGGRGVSRKITKHHKGGGGVRKWAKMPSRDLWTIPYYKATTQINVVFFLEHFPIFANFRCRCHNWWCHRLGFPARQPLRQGTSKATLFLVKHSPFLSHCNFVLKRLNHLVCSISIPPFQLAVAAFWSL